MSNRYSLIFALALFSLFSVKSLALPENIAELVEDSAPAVVNVTSTRKISSQSSRSYGGIPEELLERFAFREGPIIEGDERQHYANKLNSMNSLCCTPRIDNSKWASSYERNKRLFNGLSMFTKTILQGDEDVTNAPGHHFFYSIHFQFLKSQDLVEA